MTYPQVRHLGDGVHDDGDPLFETWILAWVAHQLPRAPAHIFDANMFYPERRALAFSETLLLPGAIAAPLRWAGVHQIVVYNLVMLSGFVISGAGMALLMRTLTGSGAAGFIAGIIFAFLPYRIDQYAHLQLQQTQCLPFAMWAFHRLLRSGRLRDGAMFGAFAAGQVLSCMYYGLFLVPYAALVCGTMLLADRAKLRRRVVPLLAAAAIVAAASTPIGIAYLGARQLVGDRGREEVVNGSAEPSSYLAVPEENVMYGKAFARFGGPERQLFLGFAAVALAVVGIWPPLSITRVAYALGGLLAFDVSRGLHGMTFPWLYDFVVPFRALRIPARMGLFTGFSVAVLAGYGAARILTRASSTAARRAAIASMAVLILAEYASVPVYLVTVPTRAPKSYDDIERDRAGGPPAALFEYPMTPKDTPGYLYYSTFHWQNMIDGYSGFFPPSYEQVRVAVANFPDDRSLAILRVRGARYIVVHGERMEFYDYLRVIGRLNRRRDVAYVSRRPSFDVGSHGDISVYRIVY